MFSYSHYIIVKHYESKSKQKYDSVVEQFSMPDNDNSDVFYAHKRMVMYFCDYIREIESNEALRYSYRKLLGNKGWSEYIDEFDNQGYIRTGEGWHWKLYECKSIKGWDNENSNGLFEITAGVVRFNLTNKLSDAPTHTAMSEFSSIQSKAKKIELIFKNTGEFAVTVNGQLWAVESSAEEVLSKVGARIDEFYSEQMQSELAKAQEALNSLNQLNQPTPESLKENIRRIFRN